MKTFVGEALAFTVGAFGVLVVKGIVKLLEVAAEADQAWRQRGSR